MVLLMAVSAQITLGVRAFCGHSSIVGVEREGGDETGMVELLTNCDFHEIVCDLGCGQECLDVTAPQTALVRRQGNEKMTRVKLPPRDQICLGWCGLIKKLG